MWVNMSWLIGKDFDARRDLGQEEKGTTQDEMAGWHHWLIGHESEWTLWVGDGQGGLACRDSSGHKESDTTDQMNWTELSDWTELMSIESLMPSNHLILCHPLVLLPSISPSIRVFSNVSALCIRWPKYCSFRVNISFSNEHSGLISFRMDRLDLLAVSTQQCLHNLNGILHQMALKDSPFLFYHTGNFGIQNRPICSSQTRLA